MSGSLPDIPNFRDAGGLATVSGRSMRRGAVYRSGQLFGLSPEQQGELVALGVGEVYDLRTASEVDHRPDSLPSSIRLTLGDVLADRPHSAAAEVASVLNNHADRASVERVNAIVGDGKVRHLMIKTYRHFVTLPSAHIAYAGLLTGIANGHGAAVVHCTAGKDRSGWGIAILQLVAGAHMDDVIADYLLSSEPMRQAYRPMLEAFAAKGGDADSLEHMVVVEPDYIAAAFSRMHEQFGDLDGYLGTGLGIGSETLDLLRERLLT